MIAPSRPCHVLVERTLDSPRAGNEQEIRAFSKCRNERLRLPAFLNHYRTLGVDRFFIVDNDSSDGTTDYLADQPDVHVFTTRGRFRDAGGGTDWLNALLMEFGAGGWCVTVDIDEWLVYPGSEQASLRTLTKYLDGNGYDTISCTLLDLYPAGSLEDCAYKAGDDPLAAAPYFDAGPYTSSPYDLCPGVVIRGGMRERVFYPERRARTLRPRAPQPSPCLTKVPLIRWTEHTRYLHSNHFVSHGNVAPDSGALLHFKFLQDFHERAIREAARGEYHNEAAEYRRYAETLEKTPGLTFLDERSMKFEDTAQLVRLGLMRETDAWARARAK